jgi:dTDP-glucose pyrophosphorylase
VSPSEIGRRKKDLAPLCIAPDRSIREALEAIAANETGIVLLTDEERRLLGTVTDGDVRRAILAGLELEGPVSALMKNDSPISGPGPVTASISATPTEMLNIMKSLRVRHLPILDEDAIVVDLVLIDELIPDPKLRIRALIMAGGYGRRLRPLTENEPKPMLHVGSRPILETTIGRLRDIGIREISISTHYLSEKIMHHFGDGQRFGVKIAYVNEDEPLGTAGALRLLPESHEPILVINGDILTNVDYRAMVAFHREHDSILTVGVRQYTMEVPYGVVEVDGTRITGLQEKPNFDFFVNTGLYVLEAEVIDNVPEGQSFHMTDLIHALLERGDPVTSFPVLERWLDIGRPFDLERACAEFNAS